MGVAAQELVTAAMWGPVCRGFSVAFANGERGCLEEIRVGDETVELIVQAAASQRLVGVDGGDIEAILPRHRRIVVAPPSARDDAAGAEVVGGIVRLPARQAPRSTGPADDAA